ncbi:MAG: hypothetical protein JO327_13010 [Nitrososphaeraceae archaeon]|nr:hypothetical protein [Nitrososphaeraceae archaeon]MBV9669035.1 hypothetical protein [Nitrososphaeraceae archaeon]
MINRPFSTDALLDFHQFLPILDEIGPTNGKSEECILLLLAKKWGTSLEYTKRGCH